VDFFGDLFLLRLLRQVLLLKLQALLLQLLYLCLDLLGLPLLKQLLLLPYGQCSLLLSNLLLSIGHDLWIFLLPVIALALLPLQVVLLAMLSRVLLYSAHIFILYTSC